MGDNYFNFGKYEIHYMNYLHQFLNISLAQANSGKTITPVCTTLSVCISIEQSHGLPESKECLGINIQDQGFTG